MAIHGKEFFISQPQVHNPDLLHTEFDFRRSSPRSGFENQKLYLVKYSKSYDLELVQDDNQYIINVE